MQRSFVRTITLASLALVLVLVHSTAQAQYKVTRLVSNPARKGVQTDANLTNAWGIARGAGSPFWVSDNGTGLSTLYTGTGGAVPLVVNIPWASGQTQGTPTGIVFNGSLNPAEFVVKENGMSGQAIFLFAALDGTISGWSPGVDRTHAIIAVDNSASGAVYTGLAITHRDSGNFLYAADTANNQVDVYDGSFTLVKTLTDANIPAGFAVYGIQDINHKLYVTFASTGNAPGGFIDVFAENGQFLKQLASGAPLNQPWGLALAPANFGPFGNALLVGNNTPNGLINAFDVKAGTFLGQLKNQAGRVIQIDQLWGIEFGGGTPVNGAANELFFTAGPQNYADGLFGSIQPPAGAAK
jgi:uncharacterized protein (TIGR03118 family)